ncbi:MAG: hypothetical protein L3J91_07570, partial [Thermoplasmata archaeon]|nr:hypothetical protein [Thermoplasmata archaeon]
MSAVSAPHQGWFPGRRSSSVILTWTILGTGIAVLVVAGLFLVPVTHTFSFRWVSTTCVGGTSSWSLPDRSMVNGQWTVGAANSAYVSLWTEHGSLVYHATGSSGAFSFVAVDSPYTVAINHGLPPPMSVAVPACFA